MWNTGVYPTVMTDGWFRTMIWAVKVLATEGGLSTGPATSPRLTSFLGDAADVEANVVTGVGGGELLVVHLHALDLTDDVGGLEHDLGVGLQHTALHTADRDGADTGDGIDRPGWAA